MSHSYHAAVVPLTVLLASALPLVAGFVFQLIDVSLQPVLEAPNTPTIGLVPDAESLPLSRSFTFVIAAGSLGSDETSNFRYPSRLLPVVLLSFTISCASLPKLVVDEAPSRT